MKLTQLSYALRLTLIVSVTLDSRSEVHSIRIGSCKGFLKLNMFTASDGYIYVHISE
jgi:hypothetical protein